MSCDKLPECSTCGVTSLTKHFLIYCEPNLQLELKVPNDLQEVLDEYCIVVGHCSEYKSLIFRLD